jgi:hypothetical protein
MRRDLGAGDPRGAVTIDSRAARRGSFAPSIAVASLVAVLLALGACISPTEIHLYVDVDDALLPRQHILQISAYSELGAPIYDDGQLVGGDAGIALPTGIRAVPQSGADHVRMRLVLRASPEDAPIQRDVAIAFARDEVRRVEVNLDAACDAVTCPAGETCACAVRGCSDPDCVAVGRCEASRACAGGREQRCEGGFWTLTCAPIEAAE